jgi:hypothetical protein
MNNGKDYHFIYFDEDSESGGFNFAEWVYVSWDGANNRQRIRFLFDRHPRELMGRN